MAGSPGHVNGGGHDIPATWCTHLRREDTVQVCARPLSLGLNAEGLAHGSRPSRSHPAQIPNPHFSTGQHPDWSPLFPLSSFLFITDHTLSTFVSFLFEVLLTDHYASHRIL